MAMATAKPCRDSVSACPPWLLSALAEIEERVKAVAQTVEAEESDSFAERAENYYEKRPQLLSLLHDLHHRYLYLAHRYSISITRCCRISSDSGFSDSDEPPLALLPDSPSSAAESSISFQHFDRDLAVAGDLVLAELVTMSVERDLLSHELEEVQRYRTEASRKMALQGSLVEVLESERAVLMRENARLDYRAAAAEVEVRGLAAEVTWMRRRAGELALCIVKLREDHRVCLLGREIEGLQSQIHALERQNREYYESMSRKETEKGESVAELMRLQSENRRLMAAASGGGSWGRMTRWWSRARKVEWPPCVPPRNQTVSAGKAWQCW